MFVYFKFLGTSPPISAVYGIVMLVENQLFTRACTSLNTTVLYIFIHHNVLLIFLGMQCVTVLSIVILSCTFVA